MTAAPVFDPAVAMKRCFGNAEMFREMVACFLAEANSLFPQMRLALQQGDLGEVGRLGHRLKATVVYLGAEAARQAALGVEHFERHSGSAVEAEQAVNALQQQCEALRSALAADSTTVSAPSSS